ncbi:unnamed protein product [Linum trigynum]|uniref:Uncharacterized protein n=1 Tax=Linum trigynum TaxID=586398 RepID=A0AAV2E974_9ROSI
MWLLVARLKTRKAPSIVEDPSRDLCSLSPKIRARRREWRGRALVGSMLYCQSRLLLPPLPKSSAASLPSFFPHLQIVFSSERRREMGHWKLDLGELSSISLSFHPSPGDNIGLKETLVS